MRLYLTRKIFAEEVQVAVWYASGIPLWYVQSLPIEFLEVLIVINIIPNSSMLFHRSRPRYKLYYQCYYMTDPWQRWSSYTLEESVSSDFAFVSDLWRQCVRDMIIHDKTSYSTAINSEISAIISVSTFCPIHAHRTWVTWQPDSHSVRTLIDVTLKILGDAM